MLAAGILLLPTVMASGPAQATKPAASTYTVLYSFTGSPTDGANPEAGVIRDTAGNLYGTTYYGGASSNCKQGCGTVFKVTASGTETVLHNFTGYQTGDGALPYGGLILDTAGNLYGTTRAGGAYSNCTNCGTVFKVTPSGTETVLYSFAGPPGDGANPYAGLILDKASNLYGTTAYGGSSSNTECGFGCGTVFKLTPSGTETVLYSFAGPPGDGANPYAGVVRDKAGNLYGTTYAGGACGSIGCGVVFKLTPGRTETLLEDFGVTSTAIKPFASLIRDSAGDLYGTTSGGGASFSGTVFKLPGGGGITEVLYSLAGGSFGFTPVAPLLRDAIGNVYGTLGRGGASDYGTVFKLTPGGAGTVLHSFAGAPTDGTNPLSGLIEDSAGNFYGTTYSGGASGFGTVYKLHP